jgi:hypothetical protein
MIAFSIATRIAEETNLKIQHIKFTKLEQQ